MYKIRHSSSNRILKQFNKSTMSTTMSTSSQISSFSTSSTSIRVIGVPEQVNIPIKICLEQGIFRKHGVDVQYTEVKEGTGKMLQMLDSSMADIAFVVTDALIAGIAQSSPMAPAQLMGTYACSPLVWSVLGYKSISEMGQMDKKIRVGVSRLGSGSHTMAHYLAHREGWAQDKLEFFPVQNIDGLKNGLNKDEFDFFMWEHFTTKPLVESGEIGRVGDVPTPWTAFSIASRPLLTSDYTDRFGNKSKDTILYESIKNNFFPALCEGIRLFKSEGGKEMIERIVKEHGHTHDDAKLWLSRVEYADTMKIDEDRTNDSVDILKSVGLVPSDFQTEKLYGLRE